LEYKFEEKCNSSEELNEKGKKIQKREKILKKTKIIEKLLKKFEKKYFFPLNE
jgi:hypothetical protein